MSGRCAATAEATSRLADLFGADLDELAEVGILWRSLCIVWSIESLPVPGPAPGLGYRPIGPLAKPKPPARPKEPPKPLSRRALTRRLTAAEANVARLREQLGQAERDAARLRDEHDKASSGSD